MSIVEREAYFQGLPDTELAAVVRASYVHYRTLKGSERDRAWEDLALCRTELEKRNKRQLYDQTLAYAALTEGFNMPCHRIETPQGTIIACTRGQSRKCHYCSSKATIACDYPTPERSSGTCGRPCCPYHAVNISKGVDYCKDHSLLRSESMNDPFGPESYDYLDSYENEYKPEHAVRPRLETLADGDYEFTILDAAIVHLVNKPVLRAGLKVEGGGIIEHTWWHDSQDKFNAMAADLLSLGFPADKWGKGGIPVKQGFPDAVAKMPGIRFKGAKRTERPTEGTYAGKVFHKLYISGRVSGKPMPGPAAEFSNGPAAQPTKGPAITWDRVPAVTDDADIPF